MAYLDYKIGTQNWLSCNKYSDGAYVKPRQPSETDMTMQIFTSNAAYGIFVLVKLINS